MEILLWVPATISFLYMGAWITRWAQLLNLTPGTSAMVFNTALCIFLLCLNGFAFNRERLHSLRQLWIVPIFLSALTGFQYLADVQLGLDEFFAPAFVRSFRSHPGRMAPVTCIGLILLSMAWAVRVNFSRESRSLIWCSGLLAASLVFILGFLSTLENLFSFRQNLFWGSYAKVSLGTSVCFVILGIFCWIEMRKYLPSFTEHPKLRWALTTAIGGTLLTLMSWQYSSHQASIDISRALTNEIQNRYEQFYQAFQYRAEELQRATVPQTHALAESKSWTPPLPSVQAVIRIGKHSEIIWNRSPFASDTDLSIFTADLKNQKSDFAFFPNLIFQRQRYMGFFFQEVLWIFSPEVVTNFFFPSDQFSYTLKLRDEILMTNESGIPSILQAWQVSMPLRLWNDQLSLDLTPTRSTLNRLESNTPRWVLLFGLGLTAILTSACALLPFRRRRITG